jgi:hypothetical protein
MCDCVRDHPGQDANGACPRPARTDGDNAASLPHRYLPQEPGPARGCVVSVPCGVRGFLARGGHPGGRGRGAATADPPDPYGHRSAQTLFMTLGFVRGQVSQTVAWQATPSRCSPPSSACRLALRAAAGPGGWWPTSSALLPVQSYRPPRCWRSPLARCSPPTLPPPAPAGPPEGCVNGFMQLANTRGPGHRAGLVDARCPFGPHRRWSVRWLGPAP